jgi:hypothetical protein
MEVVVECIDGILRIAFAGTADSLGEGEPLETVLGRVDEQVTSRRPRLVRIDFTDLAYVDSASFGKISAAVEKVSRVVPIELVGPGPGLGRLFTLIDPPRGWKWNGEIRTSPEHRSSTPAVKEAPVVTEADTEEVLGVGAIESGGPRPDIFEIDLDRELLLLKGEPPAPEYDPMAQPLDLIGMDDLFGSGRSSDPSTHPAALEDAAAAASASGARATTATVAGSQETRETAGPADRDGTPARRAHSAQGIPGEEAEIASGRRPSGRDEAIRDGAGDWADGDDVVVLLDEPIEHDPIDDDPFDEEENLELEGEVEETLEGMDDELPEIEDEEMERPEEDVGETAPRTPPGSVSGAPDPGWDPWSAGGTSAPSLSTLLGGGNLFGLPVGREALLKERLIASILSEDFLRARIAELEAERIWLRTRLEGAATGAGRAGHPAPPAAHPVEAPGPRKGVAPGGPAAPRPKARAKAPAGRKAAPGGGGCIPVPSAPIPAYLRGDVPRSRIIRAFSAVLARRRTGRSLHGEAVLRIASAMVSSVRKAPFATFDLSDARLEAPPATRAVSTTAMALCMAARAGAPNRRLRALAIGGLLVDLLAPVGSPPEVPCGEGAFRALARKIHSRILDLIGGEGIASLREAEVREDLLLVSLAREFWRRIGPAPDGGSSPAAAALAVARGEIGGRLPERLRRLFLQTFSAYPPGTWVRLESGEVGVVVAPGTKGPRGPLVLSLLAGGEGELRARPPRLIDTGLDSAGRVRAAVRCPVARCPAAHPILKTGGP